MKNNKFLKIFTYLCLLGYVLLTAFLIYHSSLDGEASSNASGAVGDEIADIIDDGSDNTKLKEPTSVFINNPINEAKVGDKYDLDVEISPSDCSYKSLTFLTSDKSIATINNSGVISFKACGNVVISVFSTDFPSIKDEISIKVSEIDLIDFSVEIYYEDKKVDPVNDIYTFTQYETYDLEFTFNPINTTNKNIKYEYDEALLTISNGVINPKAPTTTPTEVVMSIGDYKIIIRIVIVEKEIIIEPEELVITNPIEIAKVGTTYTLKVSILPSDATYKSLTYSSSDTKVAKVSTTGKITFVNAGTVTIEVSSKEFTDVKTELTITVEKIALEDFTFELYEDTTLLELVDGVYELNQYESYSIINSFTPNNASIKTIVYSYSSKNYVSVSNGVLTAKLPTTDPITVTMQCDGITKSFKVIVKEMEVEEVLLEELNIKNTNLSMKVGESINVSKLGVTFKPANVTNKSLIYASNDETVVDIQSSTLKAKQAGNAIITVTHEQSGSSVTLNVSVSNIILLDEAKPYTITQNYITFENEIYYVRNGYAGNIYLNFDESSTYTDALYSSSNPSVIIIGNDGIFSPVNEGEAVITITIDDGISEAIVYNIKFVVNNPVYTKVESFYVDNTTLSLNVGDKIKLIDNPFDIEFTPFDATNKSLTYKSLDTSIVKIESSVIKALAAGTTKIIISNLESNVEQEVTIIVKNVISIDADEPFTIKQDYLEYNKSKDLYSIRNGYSAKLNVNFNDSSTYKEVTYSCEDEAILTIGKDGVITPKSVGKTVITITIDDGYSEAITYTINVEVERTPLIEDFSAFLYKVRKSIGHFGAFLVLGIMGSFGFLLLFNKKKWLFSIPLNIALGFGVAGLTEYIQTKVPGRYGCWSDVWLDFSGYMVSTVILTFGILLVYLIIYLKNRRKMN